MWPVELGPRSVNIFRTSPFLRHAKLQPAERSIKERANVTKNRTAALQDDHNLEEMVRKVEAHALQRTPPQERAGRRVAFAKPEIVRKWHTVWWGGILIHIHLILTWAVAAALSGRRYLISPVKSTPSRWCP